MRHLVLDNMVNQHRKGMSYRNDRLLLPAAGNQPIVKCGQIRYSVSSGRPTGFDQISTQPRVSLSDPATSPFPGTLVVPARKSRPRRYIPMAGETAHVYPHHRRSPLGHSLINFGDQVQGSNSACKSLPSQFSLSVASRGYLRVEEFSLRAPDSYRGNSLGCSRTSWSYYGRTRQHQFETDFS